MGDGRGIRDEDLSSFVAGIGGPFVGAGKCENVFPVGDGREYFEGFGELAGFVAGEEEADSKYAMLALLVEEKGFWAILCVDFYDLGG